MYQGREESPEILFHLRWVAKIALSVGTLSIVGLGCVLFVLTRESGASYFDLITSHSYVHENLGSTLLIGGCFLLAFTSILTWLISLYSSFRIAGPLFRLARNIETSLTRGPVKPLPIRNSDRLHREAALLEDTLDALASHYRALEEEVDRALGEINAGQVDAQARAMIFQRLSERLARVRD